MAAFYNLSILLYRFFIQIASIRSEKARQWITGRKNIFKELKKKIKKEDRIAWFHCASLGEFEQGRPVIEKFREKYPDIKILLTFFSPSGYEIRKNYEYAEYVFYLPIDTPRNARNFIKIVKPEIAVFIKYEYWFNYLKELYRKEIPVVIVSAIFRKSQHFFKWYGKWFRKQFKNINWFFVQNAQSESLLHQIGVKDISLSGDTRFDRVWQIVENDEKFPVIEKFINNSPVILGGSTWPPEEKIFKSLFEKFTGFKFIIAPHLTSKEHIDEIADHIGKEDVVLYSEINEKEISGKSVLIIDAIGFLFKLYKYSKYAIIGGGFGVSIHNILEAAAFGKPVMFGPNYHKFKEAKDLISNQGAFEIKNKNDAIELIHRFENDQDFYKKATLTCKQYVERNKGATSIILKKMNDFIVS